MFHVSTWQGTGFSLFKTVINYESRWEVVESVFHRLRIPGTVDQLAGLAFQVKGCYYRVLSIIYQQEYQLVEYSLQYSVFLAKS